MKNTQSNIDRDKAPTLQLPKLQPIELNLSCVAGGTVYSCPDCPEK